jgi:hypothetical protein
MELLQTLTCQVNEEFVDCSIRDSSCFEAASTESTFPSHQPSCSLFLETLFSPLPLISLVNSRERKFLHLNHGKDLKNKIAKWSHLATHHWRLMHGLTNFFMTLPMVETVIAETNRDNSWSTISIKNLLIHYLKLLTVC